MEAIPVLVRDILPATVRSAVHGTFADGRVFLSNHRMIVWALDRREGVKVVLDVAVTGHNAKRKMSRFMDHRESIEVYSLADSIVITPGRGCGCGTALSWLSPPPKWTKG